MLGLIEESDKVVKDVKNIEKSVTEFKFRNQLSFALGVYQQD